MDGRAAEPGMVLPGAACGQQRGSPPYFFPPRDGAGRVGGEAGQTGGQETWQVEGGAPKGNLPCSQDHARSVPGSPVAARVSLETAVCLLGHAEDGGTAQRRLVLRELANRHRRPGSPCRFPAHFSGRPAATMSAAGVAPPDRCESEPTEGTRRADLGRITPGRRTAQTPISPHSLKKKKNRNKATRFQSRVTGNHSGGSAAAEKVRKSRQDSGEHGRGRNCPREGHRFADGPGRGAARIPAWEAGGKPECPR